MYDLYCKSSEGVSFIVELQKQKQTYFKDRSLYYTTFPIQQQAQKGEWNFKLDPVYCIGVLDFRFDDTQSDEVIHRVRLKDQNNEVFIDKLNFIFLEVPNFTLELKDCQTTQDKWLYALKHMHALEEVPEEFESVEGLPEAFEHAAMPQMSEQEYAAYHDSLKVYRDLRNVLRTAKGEGVEEGIEIGKQVKQVEVDQAKAEANQAKTEADQAKTEADQAKTEANQAKTEADQAKTEANQAKTEADQAKTEADQAKTEANQAKAEADQAKAAAELAQAQVQQALDALVESGMSEAEARAMLGLG